MSYVVVRVEKPNIGDSQDKTNCYQIDIQTESRAFAAGLAKIKTYEFVDKNNIFIFGHSMDGVNAPLVFQQEK